MIRQARRPSVSEPETPAVEPRMVDAQSRLGNEALNARLLPDTSLKAPTGAGVDAARRRSRPPPIMHGPRPRASPGATRVPSTAT